MNQQCEEFSARENKLKRDIYDVKTELEEKEQELSVISKLNEELKQSLNHEKLLMKDLTEENDVSYIIFSLSFGKFKMVSFVSESLIPQLKIWNK